ncbi:MAG: YcxB family protein [Lachnospiraceae bacterium]|nr:YcxB family protein [Lachnospiraceae bacterium]
MAGQRTIVEIAVDIRLRGDIMSRFSREFCHNEESLRRLSQVQYLSFHKRYILLQLFLGVLFVSASISGTMDRVAGVLCCLFGCWLLISWRQIPNFRARKLLKSCGGSFPRTTFCFGEGGVTIENDQGKTNLSYDRIIRLAADNDYDYLFVSTYGAYMLPREEGKKEETFQSFLSRKAHLEWLPVKSVFMISIRQLVKERKNTRKI